MPIRKIGIVTRTYRHINRYRQILLVLAKYGFDELVDNLKIAQYVEVGLQLISRGRREQVETLTRAQRLRMVLEELGPTFIKLGQVLSTRPDLVPPDLVHEFEKLQKSVPPFQAEKAREIIRTELHAPIEEVFERFDDRPLAAASIGQIHRATLRDGDEVVVKVQRPGIRRTIEVDLEILLHLATLAERHLEGARLHRPTKIVEEFARVIEQELDFHTEAAHLERFAGQFLDDPTVYVPKVYRDATTGHVLTMEYVEGIHPVSSDAVKDAGLDPKVVVARGADAILRQVFVHGFFHADPHPGNIFVLRGNVLCYLDFGMMGRIDRRSREDIADLIHGVVARDAPKCAQALLRLAERDDDVDVDVRRLERDVEEFLDRHVVSRLQELELGKLLQHLLDLLNRHRLRIPADLVMMLKALGTVEGLGAALDADFDMV